MERFLVHPQQQTTEPGHLQVLSQLRVPSARMSRYPSHLSPNITPTKSGKAQKSRARREPSGVFSLFQPQQIQQFKEAFSLIDQDRDGLVGERDLRDTFASLGAHYRAELGSTRRSPEIAYFVLSSFYILY